MRYGSITVTTILNLLIHYAGTASNQLFQMQTCLVMGFS